MSAIPGSVLLVTKWAVMVCLMEDFDEEAACCMYLFWCGFYHDRM